MGFLMTKEEYEKKKQMYMSSDAPVEVKQQALRELDIKYLNIKTDALIEYGEVKSDEL